MRYVLIIITAWLLSISSTNAQNYSCTIIPDDPEKATAFCSDCRYWPDGIMPYTFHSDVSAENRELTRAAMNEIESVNPNLRFVPRTNQSDYVEFKSSEGNSSPVGRQRGKQIIKMRDWNARMVIIHEIMHSLGFWHEQSRPDRDNYVEILWDNICEDIKHNFEKQNIGVTPNIPYDFYSIMHYHYQAGLKCTFCDCDAPPQETKTIKVQEPYTQQFQTQIGQSSYLSELDKIMLHFTYPSSKDRFINIMRPSTSNAIPTHIYNAMPRINRYTIGSLFVPEHSTVWIMPGVYKETEGVYDKAGVLKAPFGGVVLE